MSNPQALELAPRADLAVAVHDDTSSVLMMIERAAKDPSVDIGKMERLLLMHKELLAAKAQRLFQAAMRNAQASMLSITKDAKNPSNNSRYARLETIDRMAKPVYSANGFSLQFSEGDCPVPGKIRILCKVGHEGGHSETHHIDLSPDDTGAKGTPNKTKIQGEGSTFSYARRYLTCLIFNITITDEDVDGQRQPPQQKWPTNKAEPPPVEPVETDPAKARLAELWALLKPVRGPENKWNMATAWLRQHKIIGEAERVSTMTAEQLGFVIEKASIQLEEGA